MIYTTGSIEVSGNTLTGTGTNFTAAGSLIRNGCTVLALTSPAQAFQITAIDSATSLTVTPAASPAIPAGTKFAILLSDSLSVDGLAQDIAETFTMYQRYMGGFADVMNGAGDVTITINGTPVTVPGQKSLAKKGANSDITSLSGLTTPLSIAQGGTGGKDAAGARSALGVLSSAEVDNAYLKGTRNLSDLTDKAQARNQLGVYRTPGRWYRSNDPEVSSRIGFYGTTNTDPNEILVYIGKDCLRVKGIFRSDNSTPLASTTVITVKPVDIDGATRAAAVATYTPVHITYSNGPHPSTVSYLQAASTNTGSTMNITLVGDAQGVNFFMFDLHIGFVS